jgi:hypothetical protein
MAKDRGKKHAQGGASRRSKPQAREGFGDDQGTRVGSPDPERGASKRARPGTQPVDRGIEGSILDTSSDSSDQDDAKGSMGAGAEAAAGLHGASRQSRPQARRTDVTNSATSTGQPQPGRPGSEPLEGTSQGHVSGYGGQGGEPRTSSDQREPTPASEPPSNQGSTSADARLGDEEAGDDFDGSRT